MQECELQEGEKERNKTLQSPLRLQAFVIVTICLLKPGIEFFFLKNSQKSVLMTQVKIFEFFRRNCLFALSTLYRAS